MKTIFLHLAALFGLLFQGCGGQHVRQITVPLDGRTDYTSVIREILREHPQGGIRLEFESGVYDFYPEEAEERFLRVSNNDNGTKRIAFVLNGMRRVAICGNGTEFRFHGAIVPFYIADCEEVTLRSLTFDYDLPFVLEGRVIARHPEIRGVDLKITSGNPVRVVDGVLHFSGYDWERTQGDNIVFDPETRAPYYNTARFLHPYWKGRLKAEMPGKDTVRLFGFLSPELPPVGSIFADKGPFRENRHCPGIVVHATRGLTIERTVIHASGAMALICENSEEITLNGFDVRLREGSGRFISASADATHFVNCRGTIRFDGCLFENMLDDATNVHGTYLRVDSIRGGRLLTARFGHVQQQGFDFARKGDTLRLIDRISLRPQCTFVAEEARPLDDETWEIRSAAELPDSLPELLVVENPCHMPAVVMRRCTVRNNRARSILISTPGRVVIEDNYFSSMMAGVLIAGDANSWFESGSVRDVLIRNNTFVNFGTGGENPQSVLQISPEIPTAGRNGDFRYHGRIVFTGNTVRTFDSQVIYALSVDRLEITGNRFIQSRDYPPIFDGLSYIDLQYCREADISGNRFEGDRTVEVSAVACDTVRLDPRQAGFALAVVNKPNTFFYKQ
ncbi:MAG TPA: right-handed parallel beta-helix repeat-containing protein [Candidatus Alistipes cottocaccae]|nr:right-handed parallel beta-helix repeat-containing protein [Candidatus Alistipes cottocaccae]